MKTTVFIATSLDGFIAREDGGLDWLPNPSGDAAADDHGYGALMSSVDAVVMGRHTYETVLGFGGPWPYKKTRVIVLTTRPFTPPPDPHANVQPMRGEPAEVLAQLGALGVTHAYIDGGVTIQRFLAAGLIQHLIVTRIPVLLGRGIPLFGPVPHDIPLQHVRTQSFANGLVQSEYTIPAAS